MKLTELNCTNCGATLPANLTPNQTVECNSCGSTFFFTPPDSDNQIICPKCKTVNSVDKRFCLSCGQSLKTDCILCLTSNKVDATHCANCGSHLAQARSKRDWMQQKKRQHLQERQQRLKEKQARQQVEKLHMLLDDLDEPENHAMAIYQINKMGAAAIEALIETLLNDTDPDARYGSARALGQICNEHKIKGLSKARVVKTLIQALADHEAAVRYWAVDALGRCRNQTSIDPLANLLKDPHLGVRNHAKKVLASFGGERVDKILAEANKSSGTLGWIKGGKKT